MNTTKPKSWANYLHTQTTISQIKHETSVVISNLSVTSLGPIHSNHFLALQSPTEHESPPPHDMDTITPLGQTSTPELRFSPYTPGRKSKGPSNPTVTTSPLASMPLPPTPVKGYSLATTKGVPKEYNSAAKIIGLLEDFAAEHSVLADVSAWLEEAWKRKVNTSVVRFTDDRPLAQNPIQLWLPKTEMQWSRKGLGGGLKFNGINCPEVFQKTFGLASCVSAELFLVRWKRGANRWLHGFSVLQLNKPALFSMIRAWPFTPR